MAKYLILCACGTNVTSVTVAEHLKEKLRERGITDVETKCIRVAEVFNVIDTLKPDSVIFSAIIPYELSCPAFKGVAFLTGVGMDPITDQIVECLKKPHWAGKKRP